MATQRTPDPALPTSRVAMPRGSIPRQSVCSAALDRHHSRRRSALSWDRWWFRRWRRCASECARWPRPDRSRGWACTPLRHVHAGPTIPVPMVARCGRAVATTSRCACSTRSAAARIGPCASSWATSTSPSTSITVSGAGTGLGRGLRRPTPRGRAGQAATSGADRAGGVRTTGEAASIPGGSGTVGGVDAATGRRPRATLAHVPAATVAEVRAARDRDCPGVGMYALTTVALVDALTEAGVDLHPTITAPFDARVYLPPARNTLANFSAGLAFAVPSGSDPVELQRALTASARSRPPGAQPTHRPRHSPMCRCRCCIQAWAPCRAAITAGRGWPTSGRGCSRSPTPRRRRASP